jgi:hypothetical protein
MAKERWPSDVRRYTFDAGYELGLSDCLECTIVEDIDEDVSRDEEDC